MYDTSDIPPTSPIQLREIHNALLTQNVTNARTAGNDWIERATPRGMASDIRNGEMPLDYSFAALNEAGSELLESAVRFSWWSKNKPIDPVNTYVELVDILHFLLSHTLAISLVCAEQDGPDDESGADPTPSTGPLASALRDLAPDGTTFANRVMHIAVATVMQCVLTPHPTTQLLGTLFPSNGMPEPEDLRMYSSYMDRVKVRGLIRHLCQEPSLTHEPHELQHQLALAWSYFWSCCSIPEGQRDAGGRKVLSFFYGKAALNRFRQDNGYKEGLYTKVWADGREDNAHLAAWFFAQATPPNLEACYDWLKVTYPIASAAQGKEATESIQS